MKTTVLVFHPHIEKSRVNKRLAAEAEKQAEVQVRYLYDLYPDFTIDIATEQQVLTEADRIVLQFPMYWYSSPALLKQWQDDVLTHGWAYGSKGTALHGKELLIAVSFGARAEDYTHSGDLKYTITELLRPLQITSNYIGTTYLVPFETPGSMVNMSDQDLETRALAYGRYLTTGGTALGDHE